MLEMLHRPGVYPWLSPDTDRVGPRSKSAMQHSRGTETTTGAGKAKKGKTEKGTEEKPPSIHEDLTGRLFFKGTFFATDQPGTQPATPREGHPRGAANKIKPSTLGLDNPSPDRVHCLAE